MDTATITQTQPSPSPTAGDHLGVAGLPQWFTYEEAAAAMRVEPGTLMGWVKKGRVPSPTYFGIKALFSSDALAKMCGGIHPPGTYVPAPSLRSEKQREVWKKRKARERDAARKREARAARKKATDTQSPP